MFLCNINKFPSKAPNAFSYQRLQNRLQNYKKFLNYKNFTNFLDSIP